MIHFAELSSPQVADLLEGDRIPVLLLPIGAIEPHGPHAPLGTDPIISMGMCERAAKLLEHDPDVHVLVLPPVPYGVTRFAAPFPGGVHVGPKTLQLLITDICTALINQRLRHIVLVNNHFEPEHVDTLRRSVEVLSIVPGARIGHLDLVRRHNAEQLTEEFRSGSCHAGRYETSLVLADQPHLVDAVMMRELPRVSVNMPAAIKSGRGDFISMGMEEAYCGAPAEATAREGVATFETLTSMLVKTIRELTTGE